MVYEVRQGMQSAYAYEGQTVTSVVSPMDGLKCRPFLFQS